MQSLQTALEAAQALAQAISAPFNPSPAQMRECLEPVAQHCAQIEAELFVQRWKALDHAWRDMLWLRVAVIQRGDI